MAGLIPQSFIDDLLSRIDIVDIIDGRVKLKKSGRNYSACCPFHKEKSPSFSVSPDKQFYYCFGCGVSGNALGFIMDFDHLDFPAAIDYLAGYLGIDVVRDQNSSQSKQPDHSNLYNIMEQAAKFFQQQLVRNQQSLQAINYLKSRGLTGQTAKHFGIGYAPQGWNNLQAHFGKSVDIDNRLVEAGLLVENEDSNRIYDRFRDRVIFPIRDRRGRYIAFGGRILGDGKPKYLNSPETPIFHKGRELYGLYEAKKANRVLKQIIVVEGYMDVVALTQNGITNSVATLGTATTADHIQCLFKIVAEVVFCFDGDDAGRRAAWKALESTLSYMEDGRQARFLFLPQGEDPDSIIRQEGAEAFSFRIQSEALSLDSFLFKEIMKDLDIHSMDGRARLTKIIKPYMEQLPEGIYKQLVLQKLAELTGLEVERLAVHLAEVFTPKISEMAVSAEPSNHSLSGDSYYGSRQAEVSGSNSRGSYSPLLKAANKNSRSKISGAGYAIRQLMCNTRLAENVVDINGLKQNNAPDSLLLVKLLAALKSTPGLSAIALIAQEYNTKSGERLQELAAFDLGASASEQEFKETLDYIRNQAHKDDHSKRTKTLKKELSCTNVSQINSDQRYKLEQLIKQKREQFYTPDEGVEKK